MSDLFDTCVFIDYWRGNNGALSLVDAAKNNPLSVSYCTLTATELWQYPKLQRQEEIEFIALISIMQEALITTAAAMKAGQWLRNYNRNQRRILAADAIIAATAEQRGDCVRTRNQKDINKFYSNTKSY